MDLSSLGLVLIIVAASGAIAFWADKLGKKMGKKRLTVRFRRWSLRPKYVAALSTVAMGVLVSLFTIGLIALSSRDARRWLREGHQLLVQRDQLARDVELRKREEDALRSQYSKTQESLNQARSDLQKSSGEARKAEARRKTLQGIADGLQANVDRIGGELRDSQQALARNEGSLRRANAQLALLRPRVETARAALGTMQTRLAAAQKELAFAQKSLATTNTNLKVALKSKEDALKLSRDTYFKAQDLAKQVKSLEEEVATRTEEVSGLQRQIKEFAALRDDAEGRANEARNGLFALQGQLDQARQDAASLGSFIGSAVKTSRQEPLIYGAAEEVARLVVPAGATSEEAEAAVATLLRAARANAEARGAKGHQVKGGQAFDVADVFDRQDPKTGEPVSGDDLKRTVARRIVGADEDQVLVATSSLNAFRGEPVALDIAVVANPMVYRRNQLVAEARIDGSLGEERILAQLSEFVGGRVRERAEQDHMIPRANTAAPFGEVPPQDVYNIVSAVKRTGRSVRVQALAGSDTHAADPLRLEFRIK